MRKLFICIAAITAAAFGFYSCSNDDETGSKEQGESGNLRIETEISSVGSSMRSTRAGTLSSFTEGSALSLFVVNGTLGNNYPQGPYNNIKAEYKSGKWELTPAVKLSDTPAACFAFYPYNASYGNGTTNINVDHKSQIDFMYGTNAEGQSNINRDNPNVRLRMKHALSLLQFRIKKMNYPGESKLTRIEVLNATNRFDMPGAASINISTGELTALPNQYGPAAIENLKGLYTITDKAPADEKDFMDVIVLPVNKVNANGNILIRFFIDESIYSYSVPVNTSWKQGTKYIFDVTFNGTQLIIDDIMITDWVPGTKGEINLY